MTTKDTGLAAIARSTKKTSPTKLAPARTAGPASEEKPRLELEGRRHKTSVRLDLGVSNCLSDTVHAISKRFRGSTRSKVSLGDVVEAAFIAFHELPFEQQVDLVRRRRGAS